MPKVARLLATLVVIAGVVLVAAASSVASPRLELGIMDEPETLWAADPRPGLDRVAAIRARVLKVSLYWHNVARSRPFDATNPDDPAYAWEAYDRLALQANARGISLLFAIVGTPAWASGRLDWRYPPRATSDLRHFAYAAARRYSGIHAGRDGTVLPKVDRWTVWNEPNLATFLRPQWHRVGGRWAIASTGNYARMCTAVWRGVHEAGGRAGVRETVACGETSPRGYDTPGRSISPLTFLRGIAAAGARFDVYAHHPNTQRRPPTWRPPYRTMVSLGNIDVLFRELNRFYGTRMRLWITEYSYRANPPDWLLGVPWSTQARYLTQAHAIARRHPRIDMLVWFQLRDERMPGRWTSGLMTATGFKRPAYWAYLSLPR